MNLWKSNSRELYTRYWSLIQCSTLTTSVLLVGEDKPITTVSTLLANIRECIRKGDLERAKAIHAEAISCGEHTNVYVANSLINMYGKCRSPKDARTVFNTMKHRDVVSWNSIMSAYAENGQPEKTLELLYASDCVLNTRSFTIAVQACAELSSREEPRQVDGKLYKMSFLEQGMDIHSKTGRESDIFLSSALVDMYAKCGCILEARRVFDRMPYHNVVSWTAMILGYAENGEPDVALELFQHSRVQNSRTFVAAVKACSSLAVRETGKVLDGKVVKVQSLRTGAGIHSRAAGSGFDTDMFVSSALVDMYAKCGSLTEARYVYDRMPSHDIVSWTGMLLGYVDNEEEDLALEFFFRYTPQQKESFVPDAVALVAALRACTSLAAREEGSKVDERVLKAESFEKVRAVHRRAVESGCEPNVFVASALIDSYAKCGSLEDARRVFDRVVFRDAAMWNALMMGYVENGEEQLALEAFVFLRPDNCSATNLSFVAAVKACAGLAVKEDTKGVRMGSLERGMVVHSKALACGFDTELFVGNTLVDMYGKCGSTVDARITFDRMTLHNTVSWNALMFGFLENGEAQLAIQLFERMKVDHEPNSLSFIAALKACQSDEMQRVGNVEALERAKMVHSEATRGGIESDLAILNSLVDMYVKRGRMHDARLLFDAMSHSNVVSWTSLMSGYTECGEHELVMQMYKSMCEEGHARDALSYISVLKSAGSLTDVHKVEGVYIEFCRYQTMESMPTMVTTIIDAYGKCGEMDLAQQLFDSLANKDCVVWTALLSGYSRGGHAERVLEVFSHMQDERVEANDVTFLCVLAACSHAGMVEEGKRCIDVMSTRYGVQPGVEHYVCVVDMLGRADRVEEALAIVRGMPCVADETVWTSLLASCRSSSRSSEAVGRLAFEKLVEFNGKKPLGYVLMSNLYGRCDTA